MIFVHRHLLGKGHSSYQSYSHYKSNVSGTIAVNLDDLLACCQANAVAIANVQACCDANSLAISLLSTQVLAVQEAAHDDFLLVYKLLKRIFSDQRDGKQLMEVITKKFPKDNPKSRLNVRGDL